MPTQPKLTKSQLDICFQLGQQIARISLLQHIFAIGQHDGPLRDELVKQAFLEAVRGATTFGSEVYDMPQFTFDLANGIAQTVGCKAIQPGEAA